MAYIRSFGGKQDQHAKGIPITGDRCWRGIALLGHAMAEEGLEQRGKEKRPVMATLPGQGPFGGHGQKIGVRGDVIGGVAVVAMAEIGREQRQHRSRIGPC